MTSNTTRNIPEISTDVLDVRTDALIMNLVGAGVFCLCGTVASGRAAMVVALAGEAEKRDGGEQLPPADG